jgi:nucleoside-diphosphate-sugar epimerase
MRVFVAGGTGVIGRQLVPQLVARGHQVTATDDAPGQAELAVAAGRRWRRDGRAGCGVGR